MSTPPSAKRPASPDSPEAGNAHKRAREDTSTDAASSPATKTEAAPATTASNGAPTLTDNVKVEGESNGEKAKDAASAETNKGGDSKKKMEDSNMDGDAGPSQSSPPLSSIQPPSSVPSAPVPAAEPPVQQISMRCLIVTQDASVIIGRQGSHVNEIREKSGARVTVSESIPGNPERILNVSGPLDAVAKAFGLIVRRINDEPYDVASVPGSRAVTIKFIIPNSRMGSVIGKAGSKIKEIQEASGSRLNASEAMLPGSTERVLSVSGVADAVHIAVYYIGTILLEYQERNPGMVSGTYRQQGAAGGAGGGRPGYGAPGPGGPGGPGGPVGGGAGLGPAPGPGAQTQQIFIPNAMVGAIIGKGGSKINEIRAASGCQIRVTDPGTPANPGQAANPDERLVTITGAPGAINHAVQLLYARLEQEKNKMQMGGP